MFARVSHSMVITQRFVSIKWFQRIFHKAGNQPHQDVSCIYSCLSVVLRPQSVSISLKIPAWVDFTWEVSFNQTWILMFKDIKVMVKLILTYSLQLTKKPNKNQRKTPTKKLPQLFHCFSTSVIVLIITKLSPNLFLYPHGMVQYYHIIKIKTLQTQDQTIFKWKWIQELMPPRGNESKKCICGDRWRQR